MTSHIKEALTKLAKFEAEQSEMKAKLEALEGRFNTAFQDVVDRLMEANDERIDEVVYAMYRELQNELGDSFQVTLVDAKARKVRQRRHEAMLAKDRKSHEEQLRGTNGVAKVAVVAKK